MIPLSTEALFCVFPTFAVWFEYSIFILKMQKYSHLSIEGVKPLGCFFFPLSASIFIGQHGRCSVVLAGTCYLRQV